MNSRRKICIATGSRAEYGLLFPLMKEIASDPDLELQIIATGMHLSPEFGLTFRQIEADGFTIDAKVEMLLSSDSAIGISKSIGLGVIGFAEALNQLNPGILVLLGDRFEILAAAQAALVARIPIAHIHGGEVTEGVIDEAIRHAVTKMAAIHFTAAEPYRRRVIQLGESPARIFNVGALGLDNLDKTTFLNRSALEQTLDFALSPGPLLLCTYHPETLSTSDLSASVHALCAAFDQLPNARIVFTKANADSGGRLINQILDTYVEKNKNRMASFVSLGQHRYLSLLRQADAVVGNSSSGILEAPSACTPTVNIGHRQHGRLKAPSIIDCDESTLSISVALEKALSPEFKAIAAQGKTFFGDGGAAPRIKQVLKETPIGTLHLKHFFDLPLAEGI